MADNSNYSEVLLSRYQLKLDLSWLSSQANEELYAAQMQYSLTQYTPSVFAEVHFYLNTKYIKEFETIETLNTDKRGIILQALPELVYSETNKKMFSGPWKFVVLKYIVDKTTVDSNSNLIQKADDQRNGEHYYIKLQCVDLNWIKINANEDFMAFSDAKISDAIQGVLSKVGVANEVTSTKGKYHWIMSAETPYSFIKRLKPYAVTESKSEPGYIFYCFNEKSIFKSVEDSKPFPIGITLNDKLLGDAKIETTNNANLIEKYGSIDNFDIVDHGFYNYNKDKPKKAKGISYSQNMKQKEGKGKKQIILTVSKKEFKEYYATNIRKRIYQCTSIVKLTTDLNTDITPLSIINISNIDDQKRENVLNGDYYVLAVQHKIGNSPTEPSVPTTFLILGTDVNIKGQQSPEGTPLVTPGGENGIFGQMGTSSGDIFDISNNSNPIIGGTDGIEIASKGYGQDPIKTKNLTDNINNGLNQAQQDFSHVMNDINSAINSGTNAILAPINEGISAINKGLTEVTGNIKEIVDKIPKKVIDGINAIANEVIDKTSLFVGTPINTSIVTLDNAIRNIDSFIHTAYNEVIYNTVGQPIGRFTGEMYNNGYMLGQMTNEMFEPIRDYSRVLDDYIEGGGYVYYDSVNRNWYEQLSDDWIVRPYGTQIPFQNFTDEYNGPKNIISLSQFTPEEILLYQNSYGYEVPKRFLYDVQPIDKIPTPVQYTINDILYNMENLNLRFNDLGQITNVNGSIMNDYSAELNEDEKIVNVLGNKTVSNMINAWNKEVERSSENNITNINSILK